MIPDHALISRFLANDYLDCIVFTDTPEISAALYRESSAADQFNWVYLPIIKLCNIKRIINKARPEFDVNTLLSLVVA